MAGSSESEWELPSALEKAKASALQSGSQSRSEWELALQESELEKALESLSQKAKGIPWALLWAKQRVTELESNLSKLRSLQDY